MSSSASPTRLEALFTGPKPWTAWTIALLAVVIQAIPGLRGVLIYDRSGLAGGELWRVWTGHLVHFGWPHLVVDAGLLVILGWAGERRYPAFTRWGLLLMPAFVSASIYWFEPSMQRYGGLSAVNLGLLLYVAAQGWRRDWTDWFWPAVIAIYIGELVFEYYRGGQGGGAIRFDDASVSVATGAHLASAVYALLALAFARLRRPPPPSS
jgi:rhomboid family GlyGly-CTERM serine protease